MLSNRELFSEALRLYSSKGWKAIPVVSYIGFDKEGNPKREKIPLINWKEYQVKVPTQKEIEQWCNAPFADYAGVELITGSYSTEVVVCGVDFDQKDGKPNFIQFIDDLEEVMRTKTASGGFHFYFRSRNILKNATNIFDGDKDSSETIIDFRGEGGVIVVGPTPLWSHDPRTTPLDQCQILGRYETPIVESPSELKELPSSFAVALQSKATVGDKKWKQLFTPDAKKAPRHDILMSLVGRLMTGISDPEHVEGARKLVDAMARTQFGERFSSTEGREEIDRMFQYALEQQKFKRTPEARMAAKALKEAESEPLFDFWKENLKPVRCELRDDLVTFFSADGVKMSLSAKDRMVESTFRNMHHLAYGIMLPSIPKPKFEELLVAIPVERIADQSVTLEEILEDILVELTTNSTVLDDESKASRTAMRREHAVTKNEQGKLVLYFRLRALLPKLHDEGIKPKRSDITDALRSLDATTKKKNSCNLWIYETDIVGEGSSEEPV